MTACTLLDIPCHLQNVLFGWISLVPWWGWALAGLFLVGIVWKIAGWPGLIALGGAAGFILGRRSADPAHEHVDGADASTPFRPKAGRWKVAKDQSDPFARRPGENAAEWQERLGK